MTTDNENDSTETEQGGETDETTATELTPEWMETVDALAAGPEDEGAEPTIGDQQEAEAGATTSAAETSAETPPDLAPLPTPPDATLHGPAHTIPEGAIRLRIPLTEPLADSVRIEIGAEMAEVLGLKNDVETEKKEVNERLNKRIKGYDSQLEELRQQWNKATRTVDVDAYEVIDHVVGVVRAYRADNGVFLRERPIGDNERQLTIMDGGRKEQRARAEAADLTEEQIAALTPEEAEAYREQRLAREREEREQAEKVIDFATAGAAVKAEQDGEGPLTATIGELAGQGLSDAANAAEVARLAAEQAKDAESDKKRTLLKNPRRPRKLKIQDQDGNPIEVDDDKPAAPPAPAPAAAPELPVATTLCPPDCADEHQHTEERTGF